MNKELLQIQINALKVSNTQKDAEIKKLKESNDLKLRRINQLELITKKNNPDTTEPSKVEILEEKTKNMQVTIDLILSRLNSEERVRRSFQCEYCNYIFENIEDLQTHKNNEHSPKIKCKKCHGIFNDTVELNEHLKTEHPLKVHSCEKCDFVTQHENQLTKHIKDHMNRCDKCDFYSKNKDNMYYHVTRMHPQYKCQMCDFEADDQYYLNEHKHQANHMQSKIFGRSYKQNPTKSRDTVKRVTPQSSPEFQQSVTLVNQPTSPTNFKCNVCEKVSTAKDEHDLHMEYFHGDHDPWNCEDDNQNQ